MKPRVFVDLGLDAALARATAEGKLLLVSATAEWAGACRYMDRVTWSDPRLVAALAPGVLAIQIDVDAEPATKQRLAVQAMPTVVMFRDGRELDRAPGAQSPADVLVWLDALARGETALGVARREAAAAPTDMKARLSLARLLAAAGEVDEATEMMAWLWEHMLEYQPAMHDLRLSFFVTEIRRLARQHAGARARFEALRAAVDPGDAPSPSPAALADWFALSRIFDASDAPLAWFDRMRDRLELTPAMRRVFEHLVVPLLVAAGRHAEAGALYIDPVASFGLRAERRAQMSVDERTAAIMATEMRGDAVTIVRALRAAGRADDANAVDAKARELDPSPEMAHLLDGVRA